ncbi:MAG: hypothetical protein IPM13_03925 [Phycisphaerales bacterium]|nr:hypothetical protein [Phycisphaerales bacterium]
MPSRTLRTAVLALLVSFGFVEVASAYYNPRTGRFLNRDPMGEPGAMLVQRVAVGTAHFVPRDPIQGDGPNLYNYTRNRVTNRIDPFGAQSVSSQPGGDDGSNGGSPWLSKCQSRGWKPRTSSQCNYGSYVLFEADFVMKEDPWYRRDEKCSGQCTPHIILRNGGSGTCTARVNWPLDCVCSHMPDDELSNCIRGCLRCIYDNKGSAADLDEHTWCFQQCRTGWFWWSREYALYQRLDAVIHCCAKKQGTIIGPGGGAKPGPGGPKAAQKVDCCGCGPGTQRPLDCSGY